MNPLQPDRSTDILNVIIIATVALCIGLYLIGTTTIIAKDGQTFINYAQQFEVAPVKTLKNEFQHPGYPLLILAVHKIVGVFFLNTSTLSWIYSAQAVALIFRLLSLAVLYYIGKKLFSARLSFWAVVVIIFLPNPAEYGSDALSDWPHLFFLLSGFLLLLSGAVNKKWWLLGLSGFSSGLGYLVRPECAQIVVFGCLWCGLQLFWSNHSLPRKQALLSLVVMVAAFSVIAGPYMKLKGGFFPKKEIGSFSMLVQNEQIRFSQNNVKLPVLQASIAEPIMQAKLIEAFCKLFKNTCETLMWFFVPALVIGMRRFFKTRKWYDPGFFFVVCIILINVPVLVWLYCKYGYMSDRHTLPLLIVPILVVPVGLEQIALWLEEKFSKKPKACDATNSGQKFCFFALFTVGICICLPKLLTPIRIEKQGFLVVAKWLKSNTGIEDIIAVPDKRIGFYADRAWVEYRDGNPQTDVNYTVRILRDKEDAAPSGKFEYQFFDKTKRPANVTIFRNL